MKLLAIYHQPQECGNQYVMLINLEDGKPVRTIIIPEGYISSGHETVYYKEFFGEEIIVSKEMPQLPELGDWDHLKNPKTGKFEKYILTNITDRTETEFHGIIYHRANLHYTRYRTKYVFKYSSKEDDFKLELEEQGFDMKGWCVYKRRKTDFFDFLKAILPNDVINIINICLLVG